MAYLLGLSMALIPYILGKGALRLLYGSQNRQISNKADNLLVGWMMVIGLAEAAHLGAIVLGRSFSDCKIMFLGMLILLLAASALMLWAGGRGKRADKTAAANRASGVSKPAGTNKADGRKRADGRLISIRQTALLLFGIVVLLQAVVLIVNEQAYSLGDMTVETVNTILSTDSLYRINPMTGQAYELGMPLRLKILCLPTLYAVLCDTFSLSAMEVVWTVVPVMTLLAGYASYYSLSRVLFPKDGEKRMLFLLFAALLLQVGNYMYGMDGFGIQYAGYRGVTIRAVVLIPYALSVILRKRWKLVILCVLAEACMVWTLYGMGVCFFLAAAMAILYYLPGKISFLGKRREET